MIIIALIRGQWSTPNSGTTSEELNSKERLLLAIIAT